MFYRHLCNWIIFGNLTDPYQEFFICDSKCSDDDFLMSNLPSGKKNDLVSFNESLVSILLYCYVISCNCSKTLVQKQTK